MSESKLVYVHATFELKPGTDIKALLDPIAGPTRAEPGCIQYEFFKQENNNPEGTKYSAIECWRSAEDLQAHSKAPHVQGFSAKAKQYLIAPINLMVFKERVA